MNFFEESMTYRQRMVYALSSTTTTDLELLAKDSERNVRYHTFFNRHTPRRHLEVLAAEFHDEETLFHIAHFDEYRSLHSVAVPYFSDTTLLSLLEKWGFSGRQVNNDFVASVLRCRFDAVPLETVNQIAELANSNMFYILINRTGLDVSTLNVLVARFRDQNYARRIMEHPNCTTEIRCSMRANFPHVDFGDYVTVSERAFMEM